MVLWFWAWSQQQTPEAAAPEPAAPRPRKFATTLAFLAILAIGAFFRFHRLSEIPPHPGSDHAEDLLNIEDLARGERPVFFPRNTGQAPLPFYYEYFLHRLGLPINYLTLKISTALIGMLAIPAFYLMGRELGGAPLGLVAAALGAWSKWPTLGARRGLTFAWAVFPAALFLAALLRYMRRGDRASALSAGFWLGLGQYGYNAFKIVPAMVPIAFGLSLFDSRWKNNRGRLVRDGLLITATALLVFLPLLQYMLQRPGDFWYRAMTRAGSRERALPGTPAALFAGNLGRMALALHFRGDQAWINTVTEEPFLDPVTGALFLAGLIVAGVTALRGSRRWTVVLVSLFVLTLASTLALAFPVENPAINRAAVAIPSVLVIAGLPAAWLLRRAREGGRGTKTIVGTVLAGLAALSIQQNYESYFVRFRDEQIKILDPTLDVVRVMRRYRDERGVPFDNAYLLGTTGWIDGRCIDFEIGDRLWSGPHDIPPGQTRAPDSRPPAPLLRAPERHRPPGRARGGIPRRQGGAPGAAFPRSELLHLLRAALSFAGKRNGRPEGRPSQGESSGVSVPEVESEGVGQEHGHLSARDRVVRAVVPAAAARRDARRHRRFDELKLCARLRHVPEGGDQRRDLKLVTKNHSIDDVRAVHGVRVRLECLTVVQSVHNETRARDVETAERASLAVHGGPPGRACRHDDAAREAPLRWCRWCRSSRRPTDAGSIPR